MRVEVDKIASVTRRLNLGRSLTLAPEIEAVSGSVVAARVLNDKATYNQLEDAFGRMNAVSAGDIVVGALGKRNALHGYEGVVPSSVAVGDVLNFLNLGGVIGECISHNPEVGEPFRLEILGQVLSFRTFGERSGQAANVAASAVRGGEALPECPVVLVAGTCMNAGKTAAASALIRDFHRAGWRVAGAKLTGVSLLRDVLAMRDQGAEWVLDFTDAGAVCTGPDNAAHLAHTILSALGRHRPEVIVAETGDGVMGEYGVQSILGDPALRSITGAFVFCANDPVGVAGGVGYLREKFGIAVDVVAGPATDNRVGVRFIEQVLGVRAFNARTEARGFSEAVREKLLARRAA